MTHPQRGAQAQQGEHKEDGHNKVPGWLILVYVGITSFFLYYIVSFAILQSTHPQYGF